MTPQEVKLWNWLRESLHPQGFRFRRQVPVGRIIADFACLKHGLIIEIDGGQHGSSEKQAADAARDARLKESGLRVLRFWNHEIDREKQMVMDTIWRELHREATPPGAAPHKRDEVHAMRSDPSAVAMATPPGAPGAPPSPEGEGSAGAARREGAFADRRVSR